DLLRRSVALRSAPRTARSGRPAGISGGTLAGFLAAFRVARTARALERRVLANPVERADFARFILKRTGPRLLRARRRTEFVRRLGAALADDRLQRQSRL